MNEFLQMDIFFFIASFLFLILVVIAAVAGYYIWKIVREARDIVSQAKELMNEIKEEGTETVLNFKDVRQRINVVLSKNSTIKSIVTSVAAAVVAKTLKTVFKTKK